MTLCKPLAWIQTIEENKKGQFTQHIYTYTSLRSDSLVYTSSRSFKKPHKCRTTVSEVVWSPTGAVAEWIASNVRRREARIPRLSWFLEEKARPRQVWCWRLLEECGDESSSSNCRPETQKASGGERKWLLSSLHEYWVGLEQLGQFVRALSALFSKILRSFIRQSILSSITLGKESLAWCFLGEGQSKVIFSS